MSLVLNFIKGQLQRHAAAKAAAAAAKAAASAVKRSASSSKASASPSASASASASPAASATASASSAVSAVKAAPIAIAMAIASVLGGGSAKAVTAATAAKAATASTATSLSGSERITRTDAGTCLSDANASKHETSGEGVLATGSHGSEDSSLGAADCLASSARDAGLQATGGEACGGQDAGCPMASTDGDAVGCSADSAVRSAEHLDDWDERLRRGAIAAEAEYREMLRKAEERSALEHGASSLGMGLIGTPSSLFTVPRGQPIGITPSEVMPRDPLNYGQMYAFKGSPLAPRDPASPHMLDITAKQCRGLSIDEVLNEQH